jgi:hypothetical protein
MVSQSDLALFSGSHSFNIVFATSKKFPICHSEQKRQSGCPNTAVLLINHREKHGNRLSYKKFVGSPQISLDQPPKSGGWPIISQKVNTHSQKALS